MKATRKKCGNGTGMRIPASAMKPVRKKAYDLGELLRGITSKNRHEVVDFGLPRGKENW